jgi:hypothetical protein
MAEIGAVEEFWSGKLWKESALSWWEPGLRPEAAGPLLVVGFAFSKFTLWGNLLLGFYDSDIY